MALLTSTGIRALVGADQKALQFGGRVEIINATGIVRRCLEVTSGFERVQHSPERWARFTVKPSFDRSLGLPPSPTLAERTDTGRVTKPDIAAA